MRQEQSGDRSRINRSLSRGNFWKMSLHAFVSGNIRLVIIYPAADNGEVNISLEEQEGRCTWPPSLAFWTKPIKYPPSQHPRYTLRRQQQRILPAIMRFKYEIWKPISILYLLHHSASFIYPRLCRNAVRQIACLEPPRSSCLSPLLTAWTRLAHNDAQPNKRWPLSLLSCSTWLNFPKLLSF